LFVRIRVLICWSHSSIDLNRDAVVNLCSSILDLFPSHSSVSIPPNGEAKSALEEEFVAESEDPSLPQGGVVWVSYDMVHPNDTFGKMMRFDRSILLK
jgi:hypothetical protein